MDEFHRDNGVDRRLPDHGLVAVLLHRPGVVHHVVEVAGIWLALFVKSLHKCAGAGFALHPLPQSGGVWQRCGEEITRRDCYALYINGFLAIDAEHMNGFECGDELRAKTVLEVNFFSVDLLRNKNDLFVFHVYTLDWANTFRKIKDLNTAKGFSGVPTAAIFPNDGWVEALFDGGPDRERGRKVVAFDDNVRTVENRDGIDTTE